MLRTGHQQADLMTCDEVKVLHVSDHHSAGISGPVLA